MTSITLGRYRHYKGKEYTVIGVARHSESGEVLVVYRQEYGDHSLWVRPLAMFMETVLVDGKEVPRFQQIAESESWDNIMPRTSAGLLMYRIRDGVAQVLLAHPGGPFFQNKDDGAWTIPKGEPDSDEDLLVTAQREFEEETGLTPNGTFTPLKPIKQKGGKIVHAWAFEGDCDPASIKSNLFSMEWPPKSGRQMQFLEIDRAEFFDLDEARTKIKAGQEALIDELAFILTERAARSVDQSNSS